MLANIQCYKIEQNNFCCYPVCVCMCVVSGFHIYSNNTIIFHSSPLVSFNDFLTVDTNFHATFLSSFATVCVSVCVFVFVLNSYLLC